MTLPVLYPLRSTSSATVRFTNAPHGRRRVTIDHRPLAGVTPAMLLDWFTHLDGTLTYGGQTVPRYLAWHPLDHIRWELARPAPGGGAAEGARFRIVEAFGGNPAYRIDIVDRVEKLDETGIRLVTRIAGVVVVMLEHTWSACDEGTHYVSVMDLGARSAVMRPVNALLRRRFPDDMARAWVRHNIEEVGQLEHLLPRLASAEMAAGRTA
ncbi:hypothetical protein N798_09495 [Knoellia flava TL1]|uniref:Uncharacterized protein n=2 Tax=Knoellia flava TaxID=913969 RepID=A0A8H9FUF5_9MICO|nr:hypothetical protein [Knoellia flava]KGN31078.1 hypothetical protein N798_09495 [Knoellia flava TL1]GGB83003.1 hypothetical protein GCM10011314_23280 [Knoellia flava]